jgi:hypothetical protein
MRQKLGSLFDALLPVIATLAALGVGAVMLLILKVNPIEAYAALWDGAFGSANAFAETLVKATPLLLVALGICISFRGDVINIGGEGQMIIGAILATWVGLNFTGLPGWLTITLALVLSACAAPATEAPAPEAPAAEAPAATEAPAEAPAATEAPAAEPFRVAVVMPSSTTDLAFGQSMYDALVRVQEEMGAENFEFVYSEGMFVVDDAAAAIRDYATQGFDLIIAHGAVRFLPAGDRSRLPRNQFRLGNHSGHLWSAQCVRL